MLFLQLLYRFYLVLTFRSEITIKNWFCQLHAILHAVYLWGHVVVEGLDDAQNIRKMKMLTFLHLAEGRNIIDFKLIQSEIGVDNDGVEQFIIDGECAASYL